MNFMLKKAIFAILALGTIASLQAAQLNVPYHAPQQRRLVEARLKMTQSPKLTDQQRRFFDAVDRNSVAEVTTLLKAGWNPNEVISAFGLTPVEYAEMKNRAEIANKLREFGARKAGELKLRHQEPRGK